LFVIVGGGSFFLSPCFFLRLTETFFVVFSNLALFFSVLKKLQKVNEKPVIPLGQTFTIPENSKPSITCGGGPVTAQDSEVDDGIQAITWTIASGCTVPSGFSCPFVIGICDGQLRVATSEYLDENALNFESTSWDTVYTLQIKAQDDGPTPGQSATQPITLTITDVNEPPKILSTADGGTAFTVSEFATTGTVVAGNSGNIAATDVDTVGGHDVQLTFTHHNAGSVPFAVSVNGKVTVDLSNEGTTGGINFESPQKVHDLIVSVSDSGWGSTPAKPLSTSSVVVTVTITDGNDAPVIDTSWGWLSSEVLSSDSKLTSIVHVIPEDCVGISGTSAAGSSLPLCTFTLTQVDEDDLTTSSHDTPGFNSNSNGWALDDDSNCPGEFAISSSGVVSVTSAIDYEGAVTKGNDPFYCTIVAKVTDQGGKSDTITLAYEISLVVAFVIFVFLFFAFSSPDT
jgi:hypothetical protein